MDKSNNYASQIRVLRVWSLDALVSSTFTCHKDEDVEYPLLLPGIARSKGIVPGTIDGTKHVCYFRHALALDERWVKFLPEYYYGGTSLPSGVTEKRGDVSLVDHEPSH